MTETSIHKHGTRHDRDTRTFQRAQGKEMLKSIRADVDPCKHGNISLSIKQRNLVLS